MRRVSKRSLILALALGVVAVLGATHARWDNTVEPEMLAAWRAHYQGPNAPDR